MVDKIGGACGWCERE